MIITIDIGTTYVKALVFDNSLNTVFNTKSRLITHNPDPGHFEQDPDHVFIKTEDALHKALTYCQKQESKVKAICFSNAMHSIFPVDSNDNPLQNAMIWSDTRAADIVSEYLQNNDWYPVYSETGTPVHPMSPLFKIMWIQKYSDLKIKKFISLKEYIFKKWTNEYVVDYSTASASGLFNNKELIWSKRAMELADINESMLSKPVPSTSIYSYKILQDEQQNIPLVIGATDGCLATIGDLSESGSNLSLTIGTSSAARIISNKTFSHPEGKTFSYFLKKNHYIVGTPSNNGGNVLEWMSAKLLEYSDLNESLTRVKENVLMHSEPCSKGLVFIPYLYGERAPVWNSNAKGLFYGVTAVHNKTDFARAVIEGVIMNLRYNAELIESSLNKSIALSGSVLNIEGIPQLTANIFGRRVHINTGTDLSSKGAAIIAFEALNERHSGTVEANELVFLPDADLAIKYETHFQEFKKIVDTFY